MRSLVSGLLVGAFLSLASLATLDASARAVTPAAPVLTGAIQSGVLVTTPDKKLQFDQSASAGATLANVNAFKWFAYFDAPPQGPVAGTGVAAPMTCTGSALPFTCTFNAAIGTFVTGGAGVSHRIILGVQAPDGAGGFGAEVRSAECTFRFDLSPNAPTNFRFVQLLQGILESLAAPVLG